jgi:hypothetical protein
VEESERRCTGAAEDNLYASRLWTNTLRDRAHALAIFMLPLKTVALSYERFLASSVKIMLEKERQDN